MLLPCPACLLGTAVATNLACPAHFRVVTLQGQYDSEADFAKLDEHLARTEGGLPRADRIFYLSIPPNIFTAVARCASKSASSK